MNEDSEKTSAETNGSGSEQDRTLRDGVKEVNRRQLLKGALVAGAAGVAGVSFRWAQRGDSWGTSDHNWTSAEATLQTPWFDDVSPDTVHTEYPRPQLSRDRWQNLNGVWEFESDTESKPESFSKEILVPFPVESPLSGLKREADHLWYRQTFSVPDEWKIDSGERLLLHFEAVDYETVVYVNGDRVGTHTGGYDHFMFDVTDALDDGEQELVIEVYDPTDRGQPKGKQHTDPENIWYTSASGIWQTVWLEPVSEVHVESVNAMPNLDAEALSLRVKTTANDVRVEAAAFVGDDEIGSVSGSPDDQMMLPVPDPRPWSPDDPFLYDMVIRLVQNENVVDEVESYFGMRSINVETIEGVVRTTLNGEPFFSLATLDQGYWPDGIYTAPTDEALRSDLKRHRELGFNSVRKHVKIEPRRWYYHADRLGLVVWQDMPNMYGFSGSPTADEREQYEIELRRMVDELGNHPAICVWVPFNESWGGFDLSRVAGAIREWDDRLVDANSGANVENDDPGVGHILDYHNYPGPDPAPLAETRTGALGEFGGLGLVVDGHRWGTSDEYSYDAYLSPANLTEAYVQKLDRTELLAQNCGLSGAIYTQLTDVENEVNGLLTYDREVVKPDIDAVRSANESLLDVAIKPPEDGNSGELIAYWPFDEGEGATANDDVGTVDAELVGNPSWTDGRKTHALTFDGKGDYLDTGKALIDTTGDYSVEAWVQLDDRDRFQTAVSQDGQIVSGFYLQYSAEDDSLAFGAPTHDATGEVVRATAGEQPETGRWYHLLGVRDVSARAFRLFVDGELIDETQYCPGFETNGSFVIGRGRWDETNLNYWRGAIDEVRVYDRALTENEIAERYTPERE